VRGLKKPETPIIPGYQVYHNYLRPHEALEGKTPADACGIEVQCENKGITLIQDASSVRQSPSRWVSFLRARASISLAPTATPLPPLPRILGSGHRIEKELGVSHESDKLPFTTSPFQSLN